MRAHWLESCVALLCIQFCDFFGGVFGYFAAGLEWLFICCTALCEVLLTGETVTEARSRTACTPTTFQACLQTVPVNPTVNVFISPTRPTINVVAQ